jgi:hypothetical protein
MITYHQSADVTCEVRPFVSDEETLCYGEACFANDDVACLEENQCSKHMISSGREPTSRAAVAGVESVVMATPYPVGFT